MLLSYLLAFCRVVIGLVFAISSIRKMLHFSVFEQTIIRFRLLPARWSRKVALLFLACEFAVVALTLAGGRFLRFGFELAAFLLLIFGAALVSVLARDIRSSCNCFGSTERPVSPSDVWRNVGFILCALFGLVALTTSHRRDVGMGIAGWGMAGIAAAVFVMVWIQIGEIVQLFRQG